MKTLTLTADAARNWKPFVADYVAYQTRNKAGREYAGGHSVKKVGDRYQLLFGGKETGHQPMTADDLYNWIVRSPLSYFQREADDLRIALLTQ